MVVHVKTKQWGNSIGIIIPKDVVKDLGLHAGDEVAMDLKRKGNVLKKLWGALDFGENWEEEFKQFKQERWGKYI